MKNTKKITVLLFSYNQENFIESAIRGIFNSLDLIDYVYIIDDCSNDNTFFIIKNLGNTLSWDKKLIYWKNEKNLGLINSLNNALEKCLGDFIFLAAGDDISSRERFIYSKNILFNKKNKISAVFTNAKIINEHDIVGDLHSISSINRIQTLSNYIVSDHLQFFGFSSAFDKNLYIKYGPFDSKSFQEDLQLSYWAIFENGIYYLNMPYVFYRRHLNNSYNPYGYGGKLKIYLSTYYCLLISIKKIEISSKPFFIKLLFKLKLTIKILKLLIKTRLLILYSKCITSI